MPFAKIRISTKILTLHTIDCFYSIFVKFEIVKNSNLRKFWSEKYKHYMVARVSHWSSSTLLLCFHPLWLMAWPCTCMCWCCFINVLHTCQQKASVYIQHSNPGGLHVRMCMPPVYNSRPCDLYQFSVVTWFKIQEIYKSHNNRHAFVLRFWISCTVIYIYMTCKFRESYGLLNQVHVTTQF